MPTQYPTLFCTTIKKKKERKKVGKVQKAVLYFVLTAVLNQCNAEKIGGINNL